MYASHQGDAVFKLNASKVVSLGILKLPSGDDSDLKIHLEREVV